jgi:hypothetical protein
MALLTLKARSAIGLAISIILRRHKTTKPPNGGLSSCHLKKFWSGRRDSNPRPRPWQGRALPLSYTRIREIGDDRSPATVRAMPNAHRECNSLRVAFELARSPDIEAIAGKSARNGPRTVADLAGRGFREARRPAAQRTAERFEPFGEPAPKGPGQFFAARHIAIEDRPPSIPSLDPVGTGPWARNTCHPPDLRPSEPITAFTSEASGHTWNRLKFPGKPPLRCRELLNHHPGAC